MNSSCSQTVDLRNASSLLPYVYLPNEWILFEIIWPSIIFFGLTGNVIFILTVKHTPSLHTSTFIFLTGLSITDSLVLLSVGFDFILDFLMTPIRHGDIFVAKVIYFYTTWFCFLSSLFSVTLVSLERYLAICHPIKQHLLKGTKRTIKLMCIVFVGSLVFMSVVFAPILGLVIICIVWPLDDKFTSNYPKILKLYSVDDFFSVSAGGQIAQTVGMVGIVLVTFALIANCYFYIRILQALWKRKCNKTLQTSEGLERNIRQASIMVIANGTVFYLCFIVFLATMGITLMSSFNLEIINIYQVTILSDVNYTVVLINASINPLIYFITNNSYRHAFKYTLWMHARKPTTQF